jgi:hypothetical protein
MFSQSERVERRIYHWFPRTSARYFQNHSQRYEKLVWYYSDTAEKYSLSWAIFEITFSGLILVLRSTHWTLNTIFGPDVIAISAHNTNVYKIWKLCNAIFSSFYNISRPNFAILLILVCSFYSCGDLFASPCLVLTLVYNGNCLFQRFSSYCKNMVSVKLLFLLKSCL